MSDNDRRATTPTLVRAPRGAQTLEIEWADGHLGVYPHELLRGYCPCAHCQGHSGEIKYVPGGNTELADINEVGNYALEFTWGDGHGSGIYSFRYLRALCACPKCLPGSAIAARSPLPR